MNVEVTGVSATASVGQIWMSIVPIQNPSWTNIVP